MPTIPASIDTPDKLDHWIEANAEGYAASLADRCRLVAAVIKRAAEIGGRGAA